MLQRAQVLNDIEINHHHRPLPLQSLDEVCGYLHTVLYPLQASKEAQHQRLYNFLSNLAFSVALVDRSIAFDSLLAGFISKGACFVEEIMAYWF